MLEPQQQVDKCSQAFIFITATIQLQDELQEQDKTIHSGAGKYSLICRDNNTKLQSGHLGAIISPQSLNTNTVSHLSQSGVNTQLWFDLHSCSEHKDLIHTHTHTHRHGLYCLTSLQIFQLCICPFHFSPTAEPSHLNSSAINYIYHIFCICNLFFFNSRLIFWCMNSFFSGDFLTNT